MEASGNTRGVVESLGCLAIFGLSRESSSMHVVLFSLSIVGLYISSYFSLLYYGFMDVQTSFVPAFCRMEEGACHLVLRHPDAKLFGMPNWVVGIGYYFIMLVLSSGTGSPTLVSLARVASWLSVLVAAYLVYSLIFRIRIGCVLCFVCHAINVVIAMVMTFWW